MNLDQKKCSLFCQLYIARHWWFLWKEKKINHYINAHVIELKIEEVLSFSLHNLRQDSILENGFWLELPYFLMLKELVMKLHNLKKKRKLDIYIINIKFKICRWTRKLRIRERTIIKKYTKLI